MSTATRLARHGSTVSMGLAPGPASGNPQSQIGPDGAKRLPVSNIQVGQCFIARFEVEAPDAKSLDENIQTVIQRVQAEQSLRWTNTEKSKTDSKRATLTFSRDDWGPGATAPSSSADGAGSDAPTHTLPLDQPRTESTGLENDTSHELDVDVGSAGELSFDADHDGGGETQPYTEEFRILRQIVLRGESEEKLALVVNATTHQIESAGFSVQHDPPTDAGDSDASAADPGTRWSQVVHVGRMVAIEPSPQEAATPVTAANSNNTPTTHSEAPPDSPVASAAVVQRDSESDSLQSHTIDPPLPKSMSSDDRDDPDHVAGQVNQRRPKAWEVSARLSVELCLAATRGDRDCVQQVLNGANPDLCDVHGDSALHLAVAHGRTSAIRALLDANASVDQRGGRGHGALACAAYCNDIPVARMLLESGAKVDLRGAEGVTALMVAAAQGHAAMIQTLLQAGAARGILDGHGRSAESFARAHGHSALADVLSIQAGGSDKLNEAHRDRDRDGHNSRLHQAHRPARLPVDYSRIDRLFADELATAAVNGETEIVEALLQGADCNQTAQNGTTAMHCAATAGHVHVMELLVARGGGRSFTQIEQTGRTPYQLARDNGHEAAVAWIQRERQKSGDVDGDNVPAHSSSRRHGPSHESPLNSPNRNHAHQHQHQHHARSRSQSPSRHGLGTSVNNSGPGDSDRRLASPMVATPHRAKGSPDRHGGRRETFASRLAKIGVDSRSSDSPRSYASGPYSASGSVRGSGGDRDQEDMQVRWDGPMSPMSPLAQDDRASPTQLYSSYVPDRVGDRDRDRDRDRWASPRANSLQAKAQWNASNTQQRRHSHRGGTGGSARHGDSRRVRPRSTSGDLPPVTSRRSVQRLDHSMSRGLTGSNSLGGAYNTTLSLTATTEIRPMPPQLSDQEIEGLDSADLRVHLKKWLAYGRESYVDMTRVRDENAGYHEREALLREREDLRQLELSRMRAALADAEMMRDEAMNTRMEDKDQWGARLARARDEKRRAAKKAAEALKEVTDKAEAQRQELSAKLSEQAHQLSEARLTAKNATAIAKQRTKEIKEVKQAAADTLTRVKDAARGVVEELEATMADVKKRHTTEQKQLNARISSLTTELRGERDARHRERNQMRQLAARLQEVEANRASADKRASALSLLANLTLKSIPTEFLERDRTISIPWPDRDEGSSST